MTINGDPLWAEMLSLANVVFFGFLALASFRLRQRYTGWQRVLVILMGVIGLYWAALYVYVFLTPSDNPLIDPVLFGQALVRPAFTFTAAVMSSIAIYRWRSGYKP